jgi:hypothetical protein
MKLSDIDDADKIVTKEYFEVTLEAKLQKLEKDLLAQLIASERGQRLWVWGLYGLVLVLHAGIWTGIAAILLHK